MKFLSLYINESFSTTEIEKLKYLKLSFLYESSKFLVMLFLFSLLGYMNEYLASTAILLTIRNFYGGIHLKHYISCFSFTLFFFMCVVYFSETITLNHAIQQGIIFFALIVSAIIGPVTSTNRPSLPDRQKGIYNLCGTIFLFLYFLAFVLLKEFPYRNYCFWVITLQTLQLIVAKFLQKGVLYENIKKKSAKNRM